ncbi:MAG: DnaJ domain-containing protein [Melioribacteraceae bacterium]|nr:DnaJ domain-containing protein [Melioribacteraceae bacterium]
MNISKLRKLADSIFEQHNYDDAFIIYNEIYNQIWTSLGLIQNAYNEFSTKYLGGSFKSSFKLRSEFNLEVSNNIFKKWFDLDNDQTLNEFIFTIYNRLQSISYSTYLSKTISTDSVYLDFLILQNLVKDNYNDDWVNEILKITSPVVEENFLKKIKTSYSDVTIKKLIIENAEKLKETDWKELNVCILDYLFNMGDNSSNLYVSIKKLVGAHFSQKKHRKKSQSHTKEKFEGKEQNYSYQRFERHEKFSGFFDDKFDATKATEYEKAKYYGKVLGLSGKVTKAHIRKKYIELIAKYHPDKVFDLGEELKILAELKTKQINAAYEWMKKKYNI